MSLTLKFYGKKNKMTVQLDVTSYNFIHEIIPQLRTEFNLPSNTEISMFIIDVDMKPKLFKNLESISTLIEKSKSSRYIEVFWKDVNSTTNPLRVNHGRQEVDMSPVKGAVVVEGYKRYVSSDVGAGATVIGNPNGAYITIPEGALGEGTTVSIKNILVDSSKLNLPTGHINVTRHVKGDSNKVNNFVNGQGN
jgi:hypothetical protein